MRRELRHLEKLQRLAELLGIDARALLQLADVAFGERGEARGQRAQPQLGARTRTRDGVGRARRERVARPAAIARPAADARAPDAGALGDLAVGQRGLLDEAAHRCDRRVGVRPARAARPRAGDGGGVGGFAEARVEPHHGWSSEKGMHYRKINLYRPQVKSGRSQLGTG